MDPADRLAGGAEEAPWWHDSHERILQRARALDWLSLLPGIMDANAHLAAGDSARWEIYVSVDDADKTLATVSELGGTIIREAADTPFGRFGDVRDPMGAIFNVIGRIG